MKMKKIHRHLGPSAFPMKFYSQHLVYQGLCSTDVNLHSIINETDKLERKIGVVLQIVPANVLFKTLDRRLIGSKVVLNDETQKEKLFPSHSNQILRPWNHITLLQLYKCQEPNISKYLTVYDICRNYLNSNGICTENFSLYFKFLGSFYIQQTLANPVTVKPDSNIKNEPQLSTYIRKDT